MAVSVKDGLTMTVLGSGTMGTAILSGIMSSIQELQASSSPPSDLPPRLPTKFVACDSFKGVEAKVHETLDHYGFPLTTLTNDNVNGVSQADVILLACKPNVFRDILGEKGMKEALKGKIIMSILAGVTGEQIESFLYPENPHAEENCAVVRVMPNTASFVRESMTVIAARNPPLPEAQLKLVTWIFERIGKVVHLPADKLDASTALCGSGPAFCAVMLEAMADGAVAMGLPRAEAQIMAAQTMRGTTGLVLNGEHPAVLKDKVSTPGGCTIGGLCALEDGGARSAVSRAVREATVVASKLGEGTKNVNAPRP